MSSGEADRIKADPMDGFASFRKCDVGGCAWMVEGSRRCLQHGGARARQYLSTDDGDGLAWRGFDHVNPAELTDE